MPLVSSVASARHFISTNRASPEIRSATVDFSIISQIDGLLYSLLGLRLERDVYAPSAAASVTPLFGRSTFESCSSFVGLYWADPHHMHAAVCMAHMHHACGVFIVPVWPRHPHAKPLKKKEAPTKRNWFRFLMKHSLLTIRLPTDAFSVNGQPARYRHGMQAVFASFNFIGTFKSKRRPEKVFSIRVVPELVSPSGKLGVTPVLLTQESPMAAERSPRADADSAPCSGPAPDVEAEFDAQPMPSTWNVGLFRRWAADYPHKAIAKHAIAAITDGIDPFMGDINKTVDWPRRPLSDPHAELARAQLMADVQLKRAWGPSKLPPFKYFRICPQFDVPKKKHDPSNTAVRMVCNFSKGNAQSVNMICSSPFLVGFHCSPMHIRDKIASIGPGVRAWTADIPSCFRNQRVNKRLWPLFVYEIITQAHGKEFFVDLATPFGWTPSEWSWQCVLAILLWRFRVINLEEMLGYVDNFFLFVPPSLNFKMMCSKAEKVFSDIGAPLHERMVGSFFKGLGWEWDLVRMLMICPQDKFDILCGYLAEWHGQKQLSLAAVERAVGLFQWLSAGFPIGKPDVAHLIHIRTIGQAIRARKGTSPKDIILDLTPEALATVDLWATAFPAWNRECPIVQHFGPTASWSILGRVDSSTEWGCGGIFFDGSRLVGFLHKWDFDDDERAFVAERKSTGVLEAQGAFLWLSRFGSRCKGLRVLLELDNSSAVLAMDKGYSPTLHMMHFVSAARKVAIDCHIVLRVRHIVGRIFNQIADALSHNNVGKARCLALQQFGLPLLLEQ